MTLALAAATFLAILVRPFRVAEAWWACAGALLLVVTGLVPGDAAARAALRGGDVYLFLLGMMLLAEILRSQGIFERLASHALRAAGTSQTRLFALVFGVGVGVTVFFSNDATAVVLTPAVAGMLARTKVSPYPYVFACAFVANAASFVLPISNPANLVVFGDNLPQLGPWLGAFLVPSLLAIALTFLVLLVAHRVRLSARLEADAAALSAPSRGERAAAIACAVAASGLVVANSVSAPLGISTLGLALAAFAALACVDRSVLRTVPSGINYGIVPLVAGLFVIVEALDRAGGLAFARAALGHAQAFHAPFATLAAGGAIALACNVINNLPVALGVASVFAADPLASPALHHSALIAVDLGPNVAVSGSLATLLWMDALRREHLAMDALRFLRHGVAITVPALLAALLAVR